MPEHPYSIVPVGTVIAYAGLLDEANQARLRLGGWLLADGRPISSSDEEYQTLFERIGNLYGSGLDAAGQKVGDFNLPDYRGYFLRGVGGVDPDLSARTRVRQGTGTPEVVGTVQGDEIRSHNHPIQKTGAPIMQGPDTPATGGFSNGPAYAPTTGYSVWTIGHIGGKESRPVNISVNYLIRFKQV